MFQNIESSFFKEGQAKVKDSKFNVFSNVLDKKNIVIYLLAFGVSFIGLGEEMSPFSISMLAACFANSIPLLGVVAVSLIGNIIKFGVGGSLGYILTTLIMVATFYIIKPQYNEDERNEKIKVSKNVFIATILIQLAKCFITGFTLYDFLASITFSIIAVVFYKIFVNSLVVFQDIREKRAFSIEEVIGASLVLSLAISSFYSINILGFNICNILSIFIVLLLGWKQGILVGTTSGVTIGITLGIITGSEPIMIAAYAISGMVAGILNRFGKIGVIVGFCLGNVILAYVSNGYTIELIHFKEILIASIGLFLVPKKININIEDVIGKSKLLPTAPDRALSNSEETAEKLNNVSKTIQKMAETFKTENDRSAKIEINSKTNKQIFITELLDNMEPYKDNLLYDDINDVDGKIVNDIFEKVVDKQEISKADLLRIFAVNNSYVQGISNSDIEQVVRSINTAYKISKSNFVWQKKIEENNKNIETQLSGVSKAISGIAESIKKEHETDTRFEKEREEIIQKLEQYEIKADDVYIRQPDRFFVELYLNKNQESFSVQIVQKILTQVLGENIVYNEEASIGSKISFISDDKFVMAIGTSSKCKGNNEVSGDSILNIRLKDGKYLIAISDGMGAGQEAKDSSSQALKMLENLLISGFDNKQSIDLINSSLLNNNKEIFATLDIAIIDLYKGNIEFIKSGACPTYVKNNKKVQLVKSNTLPTGILQNIDLQVYDRDIFDRDIMLMCTDGVVDSNVEYKNKELWVKYVLEDLETSNTSKIADLILSEAIDNSYGIAKDDMSVITCKFLAK